MERIGLILFILFSNFFTFFILFTFRSHFFRVVRQILFPGPTVTFPEVLVADAFCSLSKPFKDFGLTLMIFYSHILQNGASPINYHNTGMIFIAILASVPFMYENSFFTFFSHL